jgi:hypothetical protein
VLRSAAGIVLAAVLAAAGYATLERQRAERLDDVLAARRELAATRLAPVGAAPQAGISARAPIRVRPIPAGLARELRTGHDFQRYSHRCGVCHATPDPALYTIEEWRQVLDRMAYMVTAAGLLPLADQDRAAILRVLAEHAGS